MGKYMRKGKISSCDAAVTEGCLGVRTRARTLALQRLQKADGDGAGDAPPPEQLSFLQLRSRRLEKPSLQPPKPGRSSSPRSKPMPRATPSPRRLRARHASSGPASGDGSVEASFGENILEFETRSRNSRESTPCSLIRNSSSASAPCSATRQTRPPRPVTVQPNMPTALEIEEFFTWAEQLQQKKFVERYNFDPVGDRPLHGRYEWSKLDS